MNQLTTGKFISKKENRTFLGVSIAEMLVGVYVLGRSIAER